MKKDKSGPPLLSLMEGRRLRDKGIATVSSPHAEWLAKARRAAMAAIRMRGTATILDVWRATPPPEGAHPNLMGAVFKTKEFIWTGQVVTNPRPSAHARIVRVYRERKNGE